MGGNSGRKKKPSDKQKRQELEAAAYNEAGYAVARVHFKLPFRYITIRQDEPARRPGRIERDALSDTIVRAIKSQRLTRQQSLKVRHHIISNFTGGWAEYRFRKSCHYWSPAYTEKGKRARDQAIELGKQIVGQARGTHLRLFVDSNWNIAKEFVQEHWTVIKCVAFKLLIHPRDRLSLKAVKDHVSFIEASIKESEERLQERINNKGFPWFAYVGPKLSTDAAIQEDDAEAVQWWLLAAEQGLALAEFILGLKCDSGEGVPQDYAEAVRWFRLAAEQGHPGAQEFLGAKYWIGQGVVEDPMTSHMWLHLAASRLTGEDREQVVEARDSVALSCTLAEIDEAQRLAREWEAAHPREP